MLSTSAPGEVPVELVIMPEWASSQRVVGIFSPRLSRDLQARIRAWNDEWKFTLNPQKTIHWPDPEIGRRWIEDGNALVEAIQAELGPRFHVVGGFADYAPEP
jgi:hypothetical protein